MILNLTHHHATNEQLKEGVVEPTDKKLVQSLLIFDEKPDMDEIYSRSTTLGDIAKFSGATKAMIGGAPYLMGALEAALKQRGIIPCYSFYKKIKTTNYGSRGESKGYIFKHEGFIDV